MAKAEAAKPQLEAVNKEERETTMMFMQKIDDALINGDDWVETSPEIVAHYNRKGMGALPYFIYRGIKACEYGKAVSIQDALDADLNRLMHGAKEAMFEGRKGPN